MRWGRKQPGERPRQTISGRPNASVFSYYSGDRNQAASRQDAPATRGKGSLRERLPFIRLRYAPSIIAITVIILSLGYLFMLNPSPTIHIIPDNAAVYHSNAEYAQAASSILKSNILNRTKITINTNHFKRQFVEQFPEVNDITIALPVMGRRPVVTIQVLPPAAIISNGSASFVLDGNGRAVLPLNQAQSSLVEHLPAIQDESGLPLKDGKLLLTKDGLNFIIELTAQLKAKNAAIQSLILTNKPNELDVRFTDKPYFVKFDVSGNARNQAGTFLAVRDKLAADGITPANYIDVRVAEKAFYK